MEHSDTPSVPEVRSSTSETTTPVATTAEKPLVFEETPVIEPQPEADRPLAEIKEEAPAPSEPPQWMPPPPPPQPPGPSFLSLVGNLVLFAGLFAVGVWLSTVLRQFIPGGGPQLTLPQPPPAVKTTPAPKTPALAKPTDPFAGWKTYKIVSGVTRQPVEGVSFKLPSDVLAPICDGQSCASQGTYLPGGTRFTVAARGAGQLLADYRGALLTDAAGRPFTMKEALVAGLAATEFRGEFTGITVGGYAFIKMRGLMFGVSEKLAIEINHFAPSGVTSDFAADETLFDKILQSVELTSAGGQKGAVIPLPSLLPSPAATTTPTLTPLR